MKKNILILILLQLSFYSYGQFTYGVKAGINFNDLVVTGSSVSDGAKPNIGFHAGVFGKLKVYKNFYFIPEIQFSQRGYNVNGLRANLNYIEVPLLLSYMPIKFINIDIGPNLGYQITYNAFVEEKFDYGLTGGLRFNISEKISIIGRYYHGFASSFDYYLVDQYGTTKAKAYTANRTIQLGVSYQIK